MNYSFGARAVLTKHLKLKPKIRRNGSLTELGTAPERIEAVSYFLFFRQQIYLTGGKASTYFKRLKFLITGSDQRRMNADKRTTQDVKLQDRGSRPPFKGIKSTGYILDFYAKLQLQHV